MTDRSAEGSASGVIVRVLGPISVTGASAGPVPMPLRLRRLLAALLTSPGTVVSVDRLADIVWADGDMPANADGALQNLVSRLRSRLRDAAGPVEVQHRAPGYRLALDRRSLDAALFHELASSGQRELDAAPGRAAALLETALDLWRGPAYAEFRDDDFARAEATRLDELRLSAQEDHVEALLRLGRDAEATARLESLVVEQSLRERLHRQLVLAHYRAGRQADALAVVRAYRRRLQEELGIDPSDLLQQLETAVLRQDRGLLLAPAEPVHGVGGQAARAAPAERLIGRDDDVESVALLAVPGSLVTLTGPGGVGKTSLVLQVSARRVSAFADGSAVVELAAVAAGHEVAPAVMTVLQLQPRQGVEPVDRLVEHLRGQELLLVLDNCEHVTDSAAALADALHNGCPGVAVLATSRSPLDVPGEQLWSVAPLPLPTASEPRPEILLQAPAARLFVQRASARNRAFVVDQSNAAHIAEVCRRLDGLPLALELAAARMSSLSPAELKRRLTWRFQLLHGGPRTAADRHRTLRSVVDWSYDLLDDEARRVFEVLSVFAGRFSLAAAEQLVRAAWHADAPEPVATDVASVVLSLVDQSMVSVVQSDASSSRYALLDTLRAYGRERLEARGAEFQARRTHAVLYCALAEEAQSHLLSADHVAAVRRLEESLDELRAAASWATEHDVAVAARLVASMSMYVEQSMSAEVPRWAERLIALAGARSDLRGLAGVHAVAAAGARFAGDLQRGYELACAGLMLAQEDQDTEAYLRFLLTEVALFQGRLSDAQDEIDRIWRMDPLPPVARMSALMGPLLSLYRGQVTQAQQSGAAVLAEAQQVGEEVTLAWATYIYGEVLIDVDPDRSAGLLEESLRASRHIGDRYLSGVALTAVASLRSRYGDPEEAVHLFLDALDHWRRFGDWTHQWTTLRNVVDLLLRLGRHDDAAVLHAALVARADVAPSFGDDAARMQAARAEIESRLGQDRMVELSDRGRRLSDDDLVAAAAGFLGGSLASSG